MAQDHLPFVPSQPRPLRNAIGKDQKDSSRPSLANLVLKVAHHVRVIYRSSFELMMSRTAGPARVAEDHRHVVYIEQSQVQFYLFLGGSVDIHQIAGVGGALQEADRRSRVFGTESGRLAKV